MKAGQKSYKRWPLVLLIFACALIVWWWPFATFVPYDYGRWLLPWWREILSAGRIDVFSSPFSNYTPPYLYLLSAITLMSGVVSPLIATKLLSALGALWVALAIFRLTKNCEAAAWSLLLPTTIINVPVLGQADTFWVAPCVFAVAGAMREKMLAMVLWASLAFAFKAQAIFLAPFVVAALLQSRAPLHYWLLPLPVYAAAMLPAWVAGWPASDLATIYLRQAEWVPDNGIAFVSNAANPWSIFKLLNLELALRSFWMGYLAACIASISYIAYFSRKAPTISGAALSATMLPFLFPGMHERFFALGEILSFCLAWTMRDRNSLLAAALMQLGLASAFFGWRFGLNVLAAAGSFFVLAAIIILIEEVVLNREPTQIRGAN